jgi:hypothetical protein
LVVTSGTLYTFELTRLKIGELELRTAGGLHPWELFTVPDDGEAAGVNSRLFLYRGAVPDASLATEYRTFQCGDMPRRFSYYVLTH